MKIMIENTIEQYDTLFALHTNEERENYFSYSMMRPFEKMWKLIGVPLKAREKNGYDVLMASQMLGFAGIHDGKTGQSALQKLKEMDALKVAEETIEHCVAISAEHGLRLKEEMIRFGVYLADHEKLQNQNGYTGFGGIPGYVIAMIDPNDYNIPRFSSLIAHEFHHNLYFSYFDWNHGDITVGEYLVIEGLADSFATALYGERHLGPWVTAIDSEELEYSMAVIGEALHQKGFGVVSAYMFGDEHAKKEGYPPVGLSAGAGYAVGYHVVQSFMKRTGTTIWEATLLGAEAIIEGCGLFNKEAHF
ncbi:hypothetical protein NCCP2222_36000 [Sporosarcina sp. NCCP-2222]|uniref:DUF2268 domain-containing protein n=1 Tax=Sporosarcina sp. NCCP-2222 TaxID=2935073 RepID=UPI00200B03E5|nr:DUF2268 domain-containing putative Zn-dependent protease [Sporosarcina sp. NCCP-2222]GKV57653.1 hypothetical protein NCCP2222_36000 [Sporosarcina sp. NCCP-2222]